MDFIEARAIRRRILKLLRQQQVEESNCVGAMRLIAAEGKRKMLRQMAEWLTAFSPESPVEFPDAETFRRIDPGYELREWQEVQRLHAQSSLALKRAAEECTTASDAYSRSATFGKVSIWFMDGKEKQAAQELGAALEAKRGVAMSCLHKITELSARISSMAEQFLRAASTPTGMEALSVNGRIGPAVIALASETSERAIAIWSPHVEKQRASIAALIDLAVTLRQEYATSTDHMLLSEGKR